MINNFIQKVSEFHNAFGVQKGNVNTQLRYDLFKEEFNEYKNATNLVERTDAIVDMLYIACGTLDLYNFNFINISIDDDFISKDKEDCLNQIEKHLEKYLETCIVWHNQHLIIYTLELAKRDFIQEFLPELFNEVHESNMSKRDKNGKPIINELNSPYYDSRKPIGKILKSELFFEPKLKEILERNGKS